MYKTDLVRKVARETRLSQRIVNDVVTESLAAITEALSRGQEVVLPGFGRFYTKQRPPGQVRHLRTGEVLDIPAMRLAAFRTGEHLRQAVRDGRRGRRRNGTAEAAA